MIAGYGSSGNEGINIALPEGTPVKAAEDGTVAYAGSDVKGYGKLVLVRHSNGYVSAYAHNGELDVKPGDKVKRGQTIAKSGASGNVTSPQLHFEIRKSGARSIRCRNSPATEAAPRTQRRSPGAAVSRFRPSAAAIRRSGCAGPPTVSGRVLARVGNSCSTGMPSFVAMARTARSR